MSFLTSHYLCFPAELLIASVLTFQEVLQICEREMKSNKGFGEKMLRFIFTAVDKRHEAGTLQHIVSSSDCDLGVFISDGNFNQWLEANVSLRFKFQRYAKTGSNFLISVRNSQTLCCTELVASVT